MCPSTPGSAVLARCEVSGSGSSNEQKKESPEKEKEEETAEPVMKKPAKRSRQKKDDDEHVPLGFQGGNDDDDEGSDGGNSAADKKKKKKADKKSNADSKTKKVKKDSKPSKQQRPSKRKGTMDDLVSLQILKRMVHMSLKINLAKLFEKFLLQMKLLPKLFHGRRMFFKPPCFPSFSSHFQKFLFPTSLVQVDPLAAQESPGLNGKNEEWVL